MKKGGFKVFRTTTKRVSSLPSYKIDKPSHEQENNISKEEAESVEIVLGDAFQDIFGDPGEEIDPNTVRQSTSRVHDDHADDDKEPEIEVESEKSNYSGPMINEGVDSTTKNDGDTDIDDMMEKLMDASEKQDKRPTSTPTKDDANSADFGDLFSFVRGEDEAEPKQKEKDDKEPKDVDTLNYNNKKRPSYGDSKTTTNIKTSFTFKSLPRIPSTFYKELQLQLEDLIFKFECLDNEYAALQKIGHSLHVETLELKKKVEL